jgi:hypothetical protein
LRRFCAVAAAALGASGGPRATAAQPATPRSRPRPRENPSTSDAARRPPRTLEGSRKVHGSAGRARSTLDSHVPGNAPRPGNARSSSSLRPRGCSSVACGVGRRASSRATVDGDRPVTQLCHFSPRRASLLDVYTQRAAAA